jgi:hypothetical protein
MNENTISLPEEFTLHFLPELKCQQCERYTYIGLIERDRSAMILHPLCESHGYREASEDATPAQRQEEYKSIERFVRWKMGNTGTATVIGSVPPASIPGYEPSFHEASDDMRSGFVPRAWEVRYQRNSETQSLHVVYDFRDWSFSAYVNGARVEEKA